MTKKPLPLPLPLPLPGALLLISACAAPPVDDVVTFRKDVAPLLEKHCNTCHVEGGIGGFSLADYDTAAGLSDVIADMTAARLMPPFGVDNSGTCQTYQDARWLSDDEIALLRAWHEGGAEEGEEAAPAQQALAPNDELDDIDVTHTLAMAEPYTPNAQLDDDYRCFLVDVGNAADAYLTAYRVNPGEAKEVHHVILFALDSDRVVDDAAGLDGAEAGAGWSCFGGAGVDARPIAGWAPGTFVTRFPDGTGVRLVGGMKMIVQVHYNLAAGALPDLTTVDLTLADEVEEEGRIIGVADTALSLEPGNPAVTSTLELPLQNIGLPLGVFIRGVFPHMHTRGSSLRFEVVHEGEAACAADVPAWDFAWQQFFFYDDPIYVYPTDTLRLTCVHDTSNETAPLAWGEGTGDEMCLMGLYVTLF